MGSFLGNYHYDQGERLGDVVLVATTTYGRGRIVVWGDTSAFQGGLSSNYRKSSGRCWRGCRGRRRGPNGLPSESPRRLGLLARRCSGCWIVVRRAEASRRDLGRACCWAGGSLGARACPTSMRGRTSTAMHF